MKTGKRNEDKVAVRDREATTSAILAAAELEFAKHGLQFARTEDIAARVGVAKGLIHHYFKTKEQLFVTVLADGNSYCSRAIDLASRAGATPTEALATFVDALMKAFEARPNLPSLFMFESIQCQGRHYQMFESSSLYLKLLPIITRGVAEGAFRKCDPWLLSINICGLCNYYFAAANNIAHMGQRGTDPLDQKVLRKNAREILEFVARGTENR